jgi:hypothetical protein
VYLTRVPSAQTIQRIGRICRDYATRASAVVHAATIPRQLMLSEYFWN